MEVKARQRLALTIIAVLGVLAVGLGVLRSGNRSSDDAPAVRIIDPSPSVDSVAVDSEDKYGELPSSTAEPAPIEGNVVVHIAGRVVNPGVYTLAPGARVNDALKSAGGAKPDADTDAVNLAARLKDGEQIYIPRKGSRQPPLRLNDGSAGYVPSVTLRPRRVAPAPVIGQTSFHSAYVTGAEPTSSSPPSSGGSGIVNINTAGPGELDKLPGVGPATAAKIIEYRKANGGFSRPEDLINVRGIGEKKLADILPYVTVR